MRALVFLFAIARDLPEEKAGQSALKVKKKKKTA